MKKESESVVLELIEKGASIILADKFTEHYLESEHDVCMRATHFGLMGKVLGETLTKANDVIEVPAHWRRLLKTKNCPKYMREIIKYEVKAYYPKLSLPNEKSWLSFEKAVEDGA